MLKALAHESRLKGIVDSHREGSKVFYTLLIPCVMSFFTCADGVLDGRS